MVVNLGKAMLEVVNGMIDGMIEGQFPKLLIGKYPLHFATKVKVQTVLIRTIVIAPEETSRSQEFPESFDLPFREFHVAMSGHVEERIVEKVEVAEGEDLCIIACGPPVAEAMRAAYLLKERDSIETRIINIHTVKPLDEAAIGRAVQEIGLILTVEEHQTGGVGNLVAGAALRLKEYNAPLRMDMIGVADRFGESGNPWDLTKAFGLAAEHVVEKAKNLLKSR